MRTFVIPLNIIIGISVEKSAKDIFIVQNVIVGNMKKEHTIL
jgi:hypothetical protein